MHDQDERQVSQVIAAQHVLISAGRGTVITPRFWVGRAVETSLRMRPREHPSTGPETMCDSLYAPEDIT